MAALPLHAAAFAHTGLGESQAAPLLQYKQEPFQRAISKCTASGLNLPVRDTMAVAPRSSFLLDAEIRLDPVAGLNLPTDVQLVVNDAGSCGAAQVAPLQVVLESCMTFDLDLALSAMTARSPNAGEAVLWARICDIDPTLPGTCAEFRRHLTFVAGSNAIETVPCDAAPVLLPEDDDGERNDDDFTSVAAPRFTVESTATTVHLLRDGVLVDSAAVVDGLADLSDTLDPTSGLVRYQAIHDDAQPSAGRYIVRFGLPAAVFANGFEP